MDESQADLARRFNALYCRSGEQTWRNTYWLGRRIVKCPLDLWIYQEILFEKRPDLIVETGTGHGTSAAYLGWICDLVGQGRIISIDVKDRGRPRHPRVSHLTGSSTSEQVLSQVRAAIAAGDSVMVLLDSDHSKQHVLDELHAYSPLVTPSQYLVVEDTNLNWWKDYGPGPAEAVEDFLGQEVGRDFRVDHEREKLFMSFNPGGYLLRES